MLTIWDLFDALEVTTDCSVLQEVVPLAVTHSLMKYVITTPVVEKI